LDNEQLIKSTGRILVSVVTEKVGEKNKLGIA